MDCRQYRKQKMCIRDRRDNRAPVFSAREGSGFAKDKTIRLLNELIADEMIRKTGNGRGTKYLIKC